MKRSNGSEIVRVLKELLLLPSEEPKLPPSNEESDDDNDCDHYDCNCDLGALGESASAAGVGVVAGLARGDGVGAWRSQSRMGCEQETREAQGLAEHKDDAYLLRAWCSTVPCPADGEGTGLRGSGEARGSLKRSVDDKGELCQNESRRIWCSEIKRERTSVST